MKNIKIISQLNLVNDELKCKDKGGIEKPVLLLQGTLDGACATYCVMMSLLLIGAIYHKDIQVYSNSKSSATKKLFKMFCEQQGMHRQGQSFYKIRKMLLESFGRVVDCEHKDVKGSQSIEVIAQTLSEDIPVILAVEEKKFAHALLAVGYEENENEEVTKLFCLDPAGAPIKGGYWNSVVNLIFDKRKVYKYTYSSGKNYKIQIKDTLSITKI